jgi:hypothetical protein
VSGRDGFALLSLTLVACTCTVYCRDRPPRQSSHSLHSGEDSGLRPVTLRFRIECSLRPSRVGGEGCCTNVSLHEYILGVVTPVNLSRDSVQRWHQSMLMVPPLHVRPPIRHPNCRLSLHLLAHVNVEFVQCPTRQRNLEETFGLNELAPKGSD